jgi:hypothetical protein
MIHRMTGRPVDCAQALGVLWEASTETNHRRLALSFIDGRRTILTDAPAVVSDDHEVSP